MLIIRWMYPHDKHSWNTTAQPASAKPAADQHTLPVRLHKHVFWEVCGELQVVVVGRSSA